MKVPTNTVLTPLFYKCGGLKMSQTDLPKIYNPANQSRKDLIDNFVVRTQIFEDIFRDIKSSDMKNPVQPYIIQGIRGQGKTTLLLRLAYEVEADINLNTWLIPIVFREEEYQIRKLFKLWERIAEYLQEKQGFENLRKEMESFEYDDDYEEKCFNLLEIKLTENGKKIIVFIDNIGDILNKLNKKEQQRLREILIQCAEIRIIGASSVSLERDFNYKSPFYELFRMPVLKGLSQEETKTLMLNLGDRYNRERVRKIVEEQPGRLEALRRMTGGVIRTIVILFQIFIDDENGKAFLDLERILDEVTPLYKHRMDSLSPQQQEIVEIIALNWDAISAKEISAKIKEQSKAISSQLKLLERDHLIEQQKTNTKNHLYRLSERFFNIWYLMRHGGKKEENKVRFLVEFLIGWCDSNELENRAIKHIEAVRKGIVYDKHAYFMTEALARTSINRQLQDELCKETKIYLDICGSEYAKVMQPSDNELMKLADQSINENNDVDSAIHQLEMLRIKDDDAFLQLGFLYGFHKHNPENAIEYLSNDHLKDNPTAKFLLAYLYDTEYKDFANAEKYYLMAIEKGNTNAINFLALLYDTEYKDFVNAEKYYLMAIEKGDTDAMYNLALLYKNEYKDYANAEKYCLMASENGNTNAINYLAALYHNEYKDFEKAEKYCLMAVEKGNIEAINNLASLYHFEYKDFDKAEKFYLMAIEKGNTDAINNLAALYHNEYKDFEKAEKYFLMAIEKDHTEAMFNLALLYESEHKDYEKAEKYYLMAIKKGNTQAMNNLALLYENKYKDFANAEKFYLMAIENGITEAMFNLAILYHYKYQDFRKAEKYYLMASEKGDADAMNILALLYDNEYKDFEKAEGYYLMAYNSDVKGVLNSLAWMYFTEKLDKAKALQYAEKQFNKEENIVFAHTYSMILLWNNEIEKALEVSKDFLNNEESYKEYPEDIRQFIMLLIAKKQYHSALKLFNENPYHLKDRFKPLYYALMYYMQDEYPNEYIKMGSELKQTVEEIIVAIQQLAEDYK
jgi:TPR repeat protein